MQDKVIYHKWDPFQVDLMGSPTKFDITILQKYLGPWLVANMPLVSDSFRNTTAASGVNSEWEGLTCKSQ